MLPGLCIDCHNATLFCTCTTAPKDKMKHTYLVCELTDLQLPAGVGSQSLSNDTILVEAESESEAITIAYDKYAMGGLMVRSVAFNVDDGAVGSIREIKQTTVIMQEP